MPGPAAVFLDLDGVIVPDLGPGTVPEDREPYSYAPGALHRLAASGFDIVIVTNQAIVARGVISEAQVAEGLRLFAERLAVVAGIDVPACYFCPHHPDVGLPPYRVRCDCRKPSSGMLVRAAAERGIDLGASFFVGDRLSDVEAGFRVKCTTILVETGMHLAPPIRSDRWSDSVVEPDHRCPDLSAAVSWILSPGKD